MTSEERFERFEQLTAGIAEERRKDREEYQALWRDTERQINAAGARIVELTEKIILIGEESQQADRRLEARIEQLAEESRAADRRLGERIDALVSGLGEFIARRQSARGAMLFYI